MEPTILQREPAPVPLACVPGAIPAAERATHFARIARLFGGEVRATHDLPDGRAYTFAADAFDEVARWVTLERRCCPFLTFALELAPAEDALRLRLTGPAGTRAFLDAELPTPSAGAIATHAIVP
jgi:hypothetical protein